jgi:hypothetical protein
MYMDQIGVSQLDQRKVYSHPHTAKPHVLPSFILRQAIRKTHSPIGFIKPERSARGINFPGGIRQPQGKYHLSNASMPVIRFVCISI